VRATGVALLGRYPVDESFAGVRRALSDANPESRVAAVRALETLYGFRAADIAQIDQLPPEQRQPLETQLNAITKDLSPPLDDPIRWVRVEAARTLSIVPRTRLPSETYALLTKRLDEYREGQLALADQSAAHLNLGVIAANQGELDKAERSY